MLSMALRAKLVGDRCKQDIQMCVELCSYRDVIKPQNDIKILKMSINICNQYLTVDCHPSNIIIA